MTTNEEDIAIEFWEHDVMSAVCDFIKLEGTDTFKDALMTFNKDIYMKLFHPDTAKSEKCYLTTPK